VNNIVLFWKAQKWGVEMEERYSMKEEFEGLDFKSKRLEERFVNTMETLGKRPDKSIWYCSENRAEAKAIYRMLGNEKVTEEEVLKSHKKAVEKRMKEYGGTILLIQDTTTLNYNSQKKMEGLGYAGEKILGINIHSCLGVSEEGLALGILDQMSYTRKEAKNRERKEERELEEKESYRWIKTLRRSREGKEEGEKVITVCDREGDMYELLDEAKKREELYLIRIAQNRMTKDNEKVLDDIRKKEIEGKIKIIVPRDAKNNKKEREVELEIRYGKYEIKRPMAKRKKKGLEEGLEIWVIHAKEVDGGEEGIEWCLMTNEEIGSVEEACKRVGYYKERWKIERFHYVLKSGCAVEKLQERSVEKMSLLVLMYSIIAVSIMNMTYIARIKPEAPCTIFFEEEEWKLLYSAGNRKKEEPEKPYGIGEAVRYLGNLGGPKRAPSDGPPGVKTIWEGLNVLNILLAYRECFV
jgi:hypothetical protein